MQKKPSTTVQEADLPRMPSRHTENVDAPIQAPQYEDPPAGASRANKRISSQLEPPPDTGTLFEAVSSHPYNLSYACLLIPRFSTHYLSGDLVEYLCSWMGQVCISFSWRLESLYVQPEHLQWSLTVPVAVPPAHVIRVIRQHTSKQILEEFPRFRKENLASDFWAPGHLVIVGRRPHPPEMVNEFIRLTRQQQGISFDHRGRSIGRG
jgi:REP element-mobilizing transposase RayT